MDSTTGFEAAPAAVSDPLASAAVLAAAGDERAMSSLLRATYPRLLRTATRILRDESIAEDVVVAGYSRAIVALRQGKFRFDAPVSVWLSRIVSLGALDALRARKRRARLSAPDSDHPELADGSPSPEDLLSARGDVRRLSEAVTGLPPRQRQALLLTEIDGLSVPEASRVMSCSRGAVELLLVRARRTLRELVPR